MHISHMVVAIDHHTVHIRLGEHHEGGEAVPQSIRPQAELPWALGAPGAARSEGGAARQVL